MYTPMAEGANHVSSGGLDIIILDPPCSDTPTTTLESRTNPRPTVAPIMPRIIEASMSLPCLAPAVATVRACVLLSSQNTLGLTLLACGGGLLPGASCCTTIPSPTGRRSAPSPWRGRSSSSWHSPPELHHQQPEQLFHEHVLPQAEHQNGLPQRMLLRKLSC